MDISEAMAKCIARVEKDADTTVTVTDGKETEQPRMKGQAQGLTLTRSDVPMSQWDNVTEWGPDVAWVDQVPLSIYLPPSLPPFLLALSRSLSPSPSPLLCLSILPDVELVEQARAETQQMPQPAVSG